MYIDDRQILILIELKGCDIERAFNQILKTYEWFYKNSGQDNVILKVRIIITHCSHFNIDYARKKLIKLCKWHINPNDIIVRKEYDDEI